MSYWGQRYSSATNWVHISEQISRFKLRTLGYKKDIEKNRHSTIRGRRKRKEMIQKRRRIPNLVQRHDVDVRCSEPKSVLDILIFPHQSLEIYLVSKPVYHRTAQYQRRKGIKHMTIRTNSSEPTRDIRRWIEPCVHPVLLSCVASCETFDMLLYTDREWLEFFICHIILCVPITDS